MAQIVFRRTGTVNANGSVPGELRIGDKTWPTIERGTDYTFVRKGTYDLVMCHKKSDREDRRVQCLCFNDSPAIDSHLIHDAAGDEHTQLRGCIAPGLSADATGIKRSADAMKDILEALGGFKMWHRVTIDVQNNIKGDETKDQWIRRRQSEAKLKVAR